MTRSLALGSFALLLVACGMGRVVHAGETTRLTADEGVLLVAAQEAARVDLRFCVDGNRGRCADVGPTLPDGGLEVYVLPAGRYCLMHVRCEETPGTISEHDVPDDEARCVDVEAGQIAYPGHVVFDRSQASGRECAGRADWLLHETIDADLRAAYPAIGGPHVTLGSPTPISAR